MSLELDVGQLYINMVEEIDEEADGDPYADLARIVETQIHQSYQQHKKS